MSAEYLPPADDEYQWMCGAFAFNGDARGYRCTRAEDHDGDHVAHGSDDRMLARWPQR